MRKVAKIQGFKVSEFQGFRVSRFQSFKVAEFQGCRVSRLQSFKVSRSGGRNLFIISGELSLGSPCSHLGMMRSRAVGLEALWVLHVIPRRRVSWKDRQMLHDRSAFLVAGVL
jgi:hypothetical protein